MASPLYRRTTPPPLPGERVVIRSHSKLLAVNPYSPPESHSAALQTCCAGQLRYHAAIFGFSYVELMMAGPAVVSGEFTLAPAFDSLHLLYAAVAG